MPESDRFEIQNHPGHRKRPWWVVCVLDEEDGSGEVISTHISEDGARRKIRRLKQEAALVEAAKMSTFEAELSHT